MNTVHTCSLSLTEESWRQKLRRIVNGLGAPPDSGAYKYAITAVERVVGPSSAATSITLTIILLLLLIRIDTNTDMHLPDTVYVTPEKVPPMDPKPDTDVVEPETTFTAIETSRLPGDVAKDITPRRVSHRAAMLIGHGHRSAG